MHDVNIRNPYCKKGTAQNFPDSYLINGKFHICNNLLMKTVAKLKYGIAKCNIKSQSKNSESYNNIEGRKNLKTNHTKILVSLEQRCSDWAILIY